jgi:hypothetical protein
LQRHARALSSAVAQNWPNAHPDPRGHVFDYSTGPLELEDWRPTVFLQRGILRVNWFVVFPIIFAAVALFMWRLQRHLEKMTGPWKL